MAVFAQADDTRSLGEYLVYIGLAGMVVTGLLLVIAKLVREHQEE